MMYVNNQDISDYEYTDIPYAEKFDISMDAYPQTIDINNNTAYTIKMNDTDVSPGGTYTTGDNVDIQGVIDGT